MCAAITAQVRQPVQGPSLGMCRDPRSASGIDHQDVPGLGRISCKYLLEVSNVLILTLASMKSTKLLVPYLHFLFEFLLTRQVIG